MVYLVDLLTLNYLQMSVKNAGLAYTISSQLDLFSGFLRMYAGIDRENRNQARKMMNNQLLDFKKGYFTELEFRADQGNDSSVFITFSR